MATKAYIDDFGIHIPSYPEVLEDIKNDFRAIYGQDLYLEPDSQEGQLCAAFALRIYDCYSLAQSVYSSYSPHTAQGAGLSSVVKTNGIRRHRYSYSFVDVRCIGQAGTVIRNGIALDEAGNRWLLPEQVTIPLQGEIMGLATAEHPGDVRAQAGEIKRIGTPTRGWQSVENPEAARPGAPVETDYQLRQRQAVSTALPSLSILDGTRGAVAQLPGVTRSWVYENDTSEPDEHAIPPHSIAAVVEGGDTQAVGAVLALKKGPGCGTYGDVPVHTVDAKGAPAIIRFFRPGIVQTAVTVVIRPLPGYLTATGETMRANTVSYINNLRIGESVMLSKLYTPLNEAEPLPGQRTFDMLAIRVGPAGQELLPQNLTVAFNQVAACALDDVSVEIAA